MYKQPVITINLEPQGIHNSIFTDRVQIKNEGRTSANNIRLNVETNSTIVKYHKVFYEENVNQPRIEDYNSLSVQGT
jgi:hypothetical protein